MNNIYDKIFWKILNDCRRLILPVINEVFREEYTGDEEIQFFHNEYFSGRQDKDKEYITNINFIVFGKTKKKYYIKRESNFPDERIAIRLSQTEADKSRIIEETLTVKFPNTVLLYLWADKKAPDKMKYVIKTPGGTVKYDIPVIKVQAYSLDDIFKKRLLLFIPFYILSHEKNLSENSSSDQKLKELNSEYQIIIEKLDELEQQGVIGVSDKKTIIDSSDDVMKEIAQKWNSDNIKIEA